MENKGALAGIKVVDLSRMLPGPFCSMILADHGARVIAVEDKRYENDLFLNNLYRNKEHMSLNLKTGQGVEIFHELVRDADVVLEGFRPGTVKKLGVDYQTIREFNPGVIYCSISGYGQTGDYSQKPGHDVNYQALSGVLDMIGDPDNGPAIPGVQLGDMVGGGYNGALGIMMALFSRQKNGYGQYIDISMTDGLTGLLPLVLEMGKLSSQPLKRGDWIFSHRYACYNTYETADGRYLAVGAVENKFWKNLCEHLGCPEYAPLQYDEEKRQEIIDFFRDKFAEKTLQEWEKEFQGLEVCCEPVKNLHEVLEDPLFRQRGSIQEFPDEKGDTKPTLGVPINLEKDPGGLRTPPANFGRDTQKIVLELGYGQEYIAELQKLGVL